MTGRSKAKGDRAERLLVSWLRAAGWENAERAYGAGRPHDVGDVDGIPGVVIECKDHQRHELGAWLTETERERRQAGAAHGVLVIKRRGTINPGDWYAVMRLDDAARLLREAGW